MPIVPVMSVTKSVAVGTPYSPVSSFNPDKRELFKTETTNLGLLDGDCTTDGVNVTVPAGTTFIQNGIVCRFTAPFVLPIPVIAYPKRVVADLTNENPGSPVTIEILPDPIPAGQVILATLDPDDLTITPAKKISIRGLHDRIEALGGMTPVVDALKDAALVKANLEELNFTGGNIAVTDPGGVRANVAVNLDVKDGAGATVTSSTKEIKFTGDTFVTMTGANQAAVDVPKLAVKDEGVVVVTQTHRINFTGAGVTAAVDGGDPNQANVNIPGAMTAPTQQISHNGAPVVTDDDVDDDYEDAGPGILGIRWTVTDVGGAPHRAEVRGFYLDCCTWHGGGSFPAPVTIPAPPNPGPGPEVISPDTPIALSPIADPEGDILQLSGVAVTDGKFLLNGNAGGTSAVTVTVRLNHSAGSIVMAVQTLLVADLQFTKFVIPFFQTGTSGLTGLSIEILARINSSDGGAPGTPVTWTTGAFPIFGLSVAAAMTSITWIAKHSRTAATPS